MDKIQEALIKHNNKGEFAFAFDIEITERDWDEALDSYFKAGFKSANLLPTEKVCPECEGKKIIIELMPHTCKTCNGAGIIQIYYTPEQYEKIMGKPYPDDVLVWGKYLQEHSWDYFPYKDVKDRYDEELLFLIVQTAQLAPPADYRPEEI